MNKRWIQIMTGLCIICMLLSVLTACNQSVGGDNKIEQPSHTHNYKKIVRSTATCNSEGIMEFNCNCGYSYTENYSMIVHDSNSIYKEAVKSVGEIITYNKSNVELALGTGFVYERNGKIITNYHVIEDAYSAKITLNNKTYPISKILAYDKSIDLAVLQIEQNNLEVTPICYKEHNVGNVVYAFGSSKGLTATFSQGIITYSSREIDGVEYVQHDAAISSGNSGGPLINQYGEVIGINTMTLKDSQNLNFAISTTEIKKLNFSKSLSFSEFYKKESDVFTKLKNYIVSKGTYDYSDNEYELTLGYTYSNDYSYKYTRIAYYDVIDNEITLALFIDSNRAVFIDIEEIDGVYSWIYVDLDDYTMSGTLYATTYDSNSLLGYSYNNIYYSSIRTSIRKLASTMVSLLLVYLDSDFKPIGVTAEDLYFYNY